MVVLALVGSHITAAQIRGRPKRRAAPLNPEEPMPKHIDSLGAWG